MIPTGEYLDERLDVRERERRVGGDGYVPHDKCNQFHDDLVEDEKEVQHRLSSFAHRADGDAKGAAERNQT